MYNGANGGACQPQKRNTRNSESSTGYYSWISFLSGYYSAGTDVFYFAYSGMGIGDICCQNAEAGI